MKKLLLFCAVGLLAPATFAQTYTVRDLDFDVQHADISLIDIDNDGDMDILISGDSDNRVVQLFLNDGFGNFSKVASPFKPVGMATQSWADFDGDGHPDLLQSGFGVDSIYVGLFRGDTLREFMDSLETFTEDRAIGEMLPQLAPGSGFADFNNDGYMDMFVMGNHTDGKSALLINDRNGSFTMDTTTFGSYQFLDPQVTVVDYDNDQDMDLFVNAFNVGDSSRFARMFVNNDSVFTATDLGLIEKSYGSATWGDFDGDGFLDLLLNGDAGPLEVETSSDIYRLYRNNNGTFEEVTTFQTFRQISVGGGGRFADWDNDGDLDIIVTGYSENEKTQLTAIYLNDNGTFTANPGNANLPGFSESHIEVGDLNSDGALDLVLTGYSGNTYNNTSLNKRATVVVINPTTTANEAPSVPANLAANTEKEGMVTFSWDTATDDKTPAAALSYNIFLINETTGRHFMYAFADTSTGMPIMQRMGNVQLNTSWVLNDLPDGIYRWGVQSVDNSLAASEFATSTFTVGDVTSAKHKIALNVAVFPNPAAGAFQVEFGQGSYEVKILAIDGREIKRAIVVNEARFELFPGVYLLHATSTDGKATVVRKVIVW
jgi:hypothetical protein